MSVTFQPRGVQTSEENYGSIWTNFSNVNASRVIAVAGLEGFDGEPLCGVCEADKLPDVAQRLIRALNSANVYSRPASVNAEPGKCRVIDCGTSEETERNRYHSLLKIVMNCIRKNTQLTWG